MVNSYTVSVISEYLLLVFLLNCIVVAKCLSKTPEHYASRDKMLGVLFNGPIIGVKSLNIKESFAFLF